MNSNPGILKFWNFWNLLSFNSDCFKGTPKCRARYPHKPRHRPGIGLLSIVLKTKILRLCYV